MSVRVIGATNVSLEDMVKAGRFRKDLFYRLNLFVIKLSPLRERQSDIIPLAEHFLSNFIIGRGLNIEDFTKEAMDALMGYEFPGNARELRNLVERAAILCRSGRIECKHLCLPESGTDESSLSGLPCEEDEGPKILRALEDAKWNRRKAAKELGIPYSTLNYKIKKLGIT